MRSTERRFGVRPLLCATVLALCLPASAYCFTPPDSPAPNRNRCLASGYWYGFYSDKPGRKPICLKLPDGFSVKMLDSNGDGVVDNPDSISSGVIFIGDNPGPDDADSAAAGDVNDSSSGITPVVEKPGGGSRRIMWRQIQ